MGDGCLAGFVVGGVTVGLVSADLLAAGAGDMLDQVVVVCVERHSLCTRLATRGEDELWITPIAVIGHVRRQRDDAGGFCRTDRARLSSGKPTRTGGALAPRSGSGAAALLKRSTESVAVLGEPATGCW